jgi:hypothetical protein
MNDRYSWNFVVGRDYRDTGSPNKEADQFLRWINLPNSGIKSMGGIRWLKTKSDNRGGPDGIVLLTNEVSGATHNPWDDLVNHHLGTIRYWGDAKFHPTKRIDDFSGNKNLRRAIDEHRRSHRPFILHFTKKRKGWVTFNGLCVLESLDLGWFQDEKRPVQNYRATLTILDCDNINAQWLADWRICDRIENRLELAPKAWRDYVKKGKISPMRAWDTKILSAERQLPDPNSLEKKAIDQLMKIDPFSFERLATELIGIVGGELIRDLEKTRDRKDGGFDFVGTFVLPDPFGYEIKFKGEIKRHKNPISPDQVSRLVARLGRGEYGIYITTSYFTRQAQSEIYEMSYPVSLVYANKLIEMIKHTDHWSEDGIDEDWIGTFN